MIEPHKNPPKFFFNFIGPKSDNQDYMPVTLETELTLAAPVYGKGMSKATPKDEEDPSDEKQKNVNVDLEENQDGVDYNPVVAGLTAKGAQPSGSRVHGLKRKHEEMAVPERMDNFSDWLRQVLRGHKRVNVTEVKKMP